MYTEKIDLINEYSKKCVRCGQCRYVCPVLAEMKKESVSPRGKVFLAGLLQKGEINTGGETDKLLSLCLTCGACTSECPSGLPVHKIITSARAKVAATKTFSPERHIIRNTFKALPLINKSPGLPWLIQQVLPVNPKYRTHKTALSLLSSTALPEIKKTRLRIGYFLGCATNIFQPQIALSTVAVLKHLGCEVRTPPVYCCGLPLETAGENDLARGYLNKNHLLFKDLNLNAIITDCSSCSHHLTENGFGVNGQPVYELTEFLFKVLEPPRPTIEADSIPTSYHDPCHLKYGRKLTGLLGLLLDFIPGINKVNIKGGSPCCGGGGTFAIKHPSLSKSILKHQTNQTKDSGAQRLITVCPSCTLQIQSKSLEVLHPAQLLYEAYGLSDRKKHKE